MVHQASILNIPIKNVYTIHVVKLRNIFLTIFGWGMCPCVTWINSWANKFQLLCLKKPALRNVLISLHTSRGYSLEKDFKQVCSFVFLFLIILRLLMKHLLANVWEQLNMDVQRKNFYKYLKNFLKCTREKVLFS